MQVGVLNLNIGVFLDIARRYLALAGRLDINGLRTVTMELPYDAFDIEDDFGHILFNAGDSRKLVLDTGDLNGSDRSTGKRG